MHAAAGGVGSLAVQIAAHLGARVIGTAGERNHEYVRTLGGEPVTYGEGLGERVRGIAPDGVEAVFDTVGGDTLKTSADLLAPEGRLASVADPQATGPRRPVLLRPPRRRGPEPPVGAGEQGAVSVHVQQVFPLECAADAQRLSQEGRLRGKTRDGGLGSRTRGAVGRGTTTASTRRARKAPLDGTFGRRAFWTTSTAA